MVPPIVPEDCHELLSSFSTILKQEPGEAMALLALKVPAVRETKGRGLVTGREKGNTGR
jgi:hypothetical protein